MLNTGLGKGGAIVRNYDGLLEAQVGAVRAALLALDSSFSTLLQEYHAKISPCYDIAVAAISKYRYATISPHHHAISPHHHATISPHRRVNAPGNACLKFCSVIVPTYSLTHTLTDIPT